MSCRPNLIGDLSDKGITKRMLYYNEFAKVCKPLRGEELPFYGIPNYACTGRIQPKFVPQLLEIMRKNPELHIASLYWQGDSRLGYNYYYPGTKGYHLCEGDADPEIRISAETDFSDFTEADWLMVKNMFNFIAETVEKNRGRKRD